MEPTVIPDNLDDLNLAGLAELEAALVAEFDELMDNTEDRRSNLARLEEITAAIQAVRAQVEVLNEQIAAEDARLDELAAEIRPADTTTEAVSDEPAETVEDTTVEADAPADDTEAVVEEDVAVAASARPSARNIARRAPAEAPAPTPEPTPTLSARIVASAEVPGVNPGQEMNLDQLVQSIHRRASSLPVTRTGDPAPSIIASVEVEHEHEITTSMTQDQINSVLTAAAGGPSPSLTAAGGWCGPMTPIYDLFDVTGPTGLLSLPTIGITRGGGVSVPEYIGWADADGAVFDWPEAVDISAASPAPIATYEATDGAVKITTVADHGLIVGQSVAITGSGVSALDGTYQVLTVPDATSFTITAALVANAAASPAGGLAASTKPCLRVKCGEWIDYVLGAKGLCVTAGNLADRSFPEATRRTVAMAMEALDRVNSTSHIANIASDANSAVVNIADNAATDPWGVLLNAIDLSVASYRSQHRLGDNAVVEWVMPAWTKELLRSAKNARAGFDPRAISDAEIMSEFTTRKARAQFLEDYQPLFTGAPATAFPESMTGLMFPAGSFMEGDGGTLDLGVTRDSVQNSTNDHTAAFVERFTTTIRRGPKAQATTITYGKIDGVTG